MFACLCLCLCVLAKGAALKVLVGVRQNVWKGVMSWSHVIKNRASRRTGRAANYAGKHDGSLREIERGKHACKE